MKQGSGRSTMSGRKVEPSGKSYTPGVVSQIGEALGNHATDTTRILHGASAPMYEGRGNAFTAPLTKCVPHKAGSQGRR